MIPLLDRPAIITENGRSLITGGDDHSLGEEIMLRFSSWFAMAFLAGLLSLSMMPTLLAGEAKVYSEASVTISGMT